MLKIMLLFFLIMFKTVQMISIQILKAIRLPKKMTGNDKTKK